MLFYTLLIPIPDVFVSVFVVYYFCMFSFTIYFLECLIIFENVLDGILKRSVCVWMMSETIISFSKGSFSFAFVRQLSTPLGQSFRVWRLRSSTPPRQAEFGRHVYARAYFQLDIFLRVSSFGVPVQMWGDYSDSQLSTYLHLCPIYCKPTNLTAGFHRCLLPPANAFRQK